MSVFELTPKIYFGEKAIKNLKHELRADDFKHVFIVINETGLQSKALVDLTMVLKDLKLSYFIYQINEDFVDTEEVYEASILFNKKNSKVVISLGNYETIDFAKLLAVYAPNKNLHKSVWHYVEDPGAIRHYAYPVIAIPLGLDLGSSSNGLSLLINTKKMIAQGVVSYSASPRVVIYDVNYWKQLDLQVLKKEMQTFLLQNILYILSSNKKDWYWTKNFNYTCLISNLKAILTLLKNQQYEMAWNILFTSNTLTGTVLPVFEINYPYDFISLLLGINGMAKANYMELFNYVFWPYCEQRLKTDSAFKTEFASLNKALFNVETTDLNLLKQYFIKNFGLTKLIFDWNENQKQEMIAKAVVQYQKNFLDVIYSTHDEYQNNMEQTTSFFTKIIYSLN